MCLCKTFLIEDGLFTQDGPRGNPFFEANCPKMSLFVAPKLLLLFYFSPLVIDVTFLYNAELNPLNPVQSEVVRCHREESHERFFNIFQVQHIELNDTRVTACFYTQQRSRRFFFFEASVRNLVLFFLDCFTLRAKSVWRTHSNRHNGHLAFLSHLPPY